MKMMGERGSEPALISASTILILSGFLVGMSLSHPLGELSFYIFTCGLTGLIAYITFEMTGVREDRESLLRSQKLMEERLLRHVAFSLPDHRTPSQEHSEKKRLLEWLNRETKALTP